MSQDKIETNLLSIENKNLIIKELTQFLNEHSMDEGNKNYGFDLLQEFITCHKSILKGINADSFDIMELIIEAVKYYLSEEIESNTNSLQNTPIYYQSDNEQAIENYECTEQSEHIQNSKQEKNIIEFKKSTWAKELVDMKRKKILQVNREKKDSNNYHEQEISEPKKFKVDHDKAKAYLQEIEDKIKNGNVQDLKEQMEDIQKLVTVYKKSEDFIESLVIILKQSMDKKYPFKTVYILEDVYEYLQHHNIFDSLTPNDLFIQSLDFLVDKYKYSHYEILSLLKQLYPELLVDLY